MGREAPLQLNLEAQGMGSQTQVEGVASLKEKQPEPGSRGLSGGWGMACTPGWGPEPWDHVWKAGLGPLQGLRGQHEGFGWYSMSSKDPPSTPPEGRKKDARV